MFELCLILGIVCMISAAVLGVYRGPHQKSPRLSGGTQAAGNRRLSVPAKHADSSLFSADDDYFVNFDAFNDPELAVNPVSSGDSVMDEKQKVQSFLQKIAADKDEDDDEDSEAIPKGNVSSESFVPTLTLASLLEVQRSEASVPAPDLRPRILGDEARELGMRYFRFMLSHHLIPRGNAHVTSESNILVAENALRNSRQSVTLSHGAVAQNIGEHAVCLFEPLKASVSNIERAAELLSDVLASKTVFIVMADTDGVPAENLRHLGAVCRRFNIPKTCIFIEQPDETFINYIEDVSDFVPARIDAMLMPQGFFSRILDYASTAYDEGDYEAVMRTVEPLLQPLYARIRQKRDFPKLLAAQALNLVGMTHRDIGQDSNAIACFELSSALLREIEDYEDLKAVLANLGISQALARPVTKPRIEMAIRHLSEVTQLNPRDSEAWIYLANSYLEQCRLTGAQSLMRRALRAYEKAYELDSSAEIGQCMHALQVQLGIRPQAVHVSGNRGAASNSASQNGG